MKFGDFRRNFGQWQELVRSKDQLRAALGRFGEVIPDLQGLVGKVTQFAIEDFSPATAGEDATSPPVPGSRADLLLRLQRLERQVEALEKPGGSEVR